MRGSLIQWDKIKVLQRPSRLNLYPQAKVKMDLDLRGQSGLDDGRDHGC